MILQAWQWLRLLLSLAMVAEGSKRQNKHE